jgi:recombination protein RecT
VQIQIRSMEEEFRKAMPAGEAVQFVRDAMTCLQTIRNLDKCEPRSVLGALMTCAQLGLRPAVLGHAWPLPFWDANLEIRDPQSGRPRKGGHKAQLVIGYQGLTHLAYESGKVASVKAAPVFEDDEFDWDMGSDQPPLHRRPRFGTPRGAVVGYYAVVRTVMGGHLVYAMDLPEMLRFREQFAPRGKKPAEGPAPIVGPWSKPIESAEFTAMSLKTVLRYALKTAPKSAQLARAEAVDGTVRVDTSVLSEPAAVSAHPVLEAGPGDVVADAVTPPDPHDGQDPWAGDPR